MPSYGRDKDFCYFAYCHCSFGGSFADLIFPAAHLLAYLVPSLFVFPNRFVVENAGMWNGSLENVMGSPLWIRLARLHPEADKDGIVYSITYNVVAQKICLLV